MTSYNTCAYPGCYHRIAYEPGETQPEKYCECHSTRERSNLIPTRTRIASNRIVILECPRCHQRKEVPYSEWMQNTIPISTNRIRCENSKCEGKHAMVYHKEVMR